jgi:hypothetical protein
MHMPRRVYYDPEDFMRNLKEFSGACQAIGAALARNGHTVIVDIASWERLRTQTIAAPHIIQGVKNEKLSTKPFEIVLYQPRETEPTGEATPEPDTIAELKAPIANNPSNIEWTQKIYVSEQDFFANMQDADAFILLGGGPGTGLTGQTAAYLGKPVVALRGFGGAARDSFDLVLSSFYRELNVQSTDMVALTKAWDSDPAKNRDDAESVVRFMADLKAALSRREVPEFRAQRNFLLILPITLLIWVLIFISLPVLTPAVAYILLLILSAVLGTGLRLLPTMQSKNAPPFTPLFIWMQLTLSILVAFGLMLVYLIGGISFTGSMVDLVTSGNSAIATGLSVIGFAAGFLLPIARLRTQLGDAIAGTPGPSKT